jgi:hypothetical protein
MGGINNIHDPSPAAPYISRMVTAGFWPRPRANRLRALAGDSAWFGPVGMCVEPNGAILCGCRERMGPAAWAIHARPCPSAPVDEIALDCAEFCARRRSGALEAKPVPLPERVGVYAITDTHGNVKIGKSWQSARSRLESGQTWSPATLTLVGMVSEDPHDEKAIHKHLREHHIRGEWFRLEGLALELVEMSKVGRGWFDLKRAELEAA